MAAVHSSSNNEHRASGTASPSWHFPRSGLGTPDLFYSFSGSNSSPQQSHRPQQQQQQQQQPNPSWLKQPAEPQPQTRRTRSAVKREEQDDNDGNDIAESNQKQETALDAVASTSAQPTGNEEASRTTRALSDPPVRQSPAWIFPMGGGGVPMTHLESEPNPFEHSFSVPGPANAHQQYQHGHGFGGVQGGGAPFNNAGAGGAQGSSQQQRHDQQSQASQQQQNQYHNAYNHGGRNASQGAYEIGPARRARSQSPKSAAGGWGHTTNNTNNAQVSYGAGHPFANSTNPQTMQTPSSELPNFGWGAFGGSGMFDPSSIRTGLTPGGIMGGGPDNRSNGSNNRTREGHPNQPPHSPATQALFAMMTNATPGADLHQSAQNADSQQKQQQQPNAGQGGAETSSGNNSNNSPVNSQNISRPPSGLDAKAAGSNVFQSQQQLQQYIPPLQSSFGNAANTHAQYQQALHQHRSGSSNYTAQNPQGGGNMNSNAGFLQQAMPRPIPAHAFNSNASSQASSNQSGSQNRPTIAQNPNSDNSNNPLYFLSQQAQANDGPNLPQQGAVQGRNMPHLPPNAHLQGDFANLAAGADGHNDDAMLAAAALSGLSTPRPVYVGGPAQMSSVNPGTISAAQPVPNLVQPPLGRQRQQPRPSQLQAQQVPLDQSSQTNPAGPTRAGSKRGAAAQNKRKKGETATPPPAPGEADGQQSTSNKKARRAPSRRGKAAQKQEEEEEDLSAMKDEDDDDDDMDMLSQNGSQMDDTGEGSYLRQWQDANGLDHFDVSPPRKGGRGPKQHFSNEEDKRKNFLERNRQAALKCRQRKKQWLQQLQAKVEYLTEDNETLQSTVGHLREEVASMRSLLAAHKDCPLNIPPGPNGPGGLSTVGAYMHQVRQQQHSQGPPPPQHFQQAPSGQY